MEKKPTSGLAVTGLVTGIIALISSFVPLLNLLSFPFVLLAIIFGGIGLWQTSKGAKGGKGIAIAGLVLGVLSLLVTVVMYGGAASVADTSSSTSGASQSSAQTEAAPAQDNAQEADGSEAGEDAEGAAAAEEAEPAKYAVTIGDGALGEDYEGNPAAVVTYTFTNNSDKAVSPVAAVQAKAFQNGVELDLAIMVDGVDSGKSMNEVKPGASATYQLAYALQDQSDMTVEVEELFSFDDTLIAEKTFTIS